MLSQKKNLLTPQRPWLEKKLIEPDAIEARCLSIRERGYTIGTVNGCFDLLHTGHLFFIHEASQLVDVLFVALNSDQSIRQYKNRFRPLVSLSERLEMVAALEFVQHVTWFEEEDPCQLLQKIKPDVHVNGAEYANRCIEAPLIQKNGGRMHFVERLEGRSTTALIEKAKRCRS